MLPEMWWELTDLVFDEGIQFVCRTNLLGFGATGRLFGLGTVLIDYPKSRSTKLPHGSSSFGEALRAQLIAIRVSQVERLPAPQRNQVSHKLYTNSLGLHLPHLLCFVRWRKLSDKAWAYAF